MDLMEGAVRRRGCCAWLASRHQQTCMLFGGPVLILLIADVSLQTLQSPAQAPKFEPAPYTLYCLSLLCHRSLFPDRDCFSLVRPMNDETQLANLDRVPKDQLRPEFSQVRA